MSFAERLGEALRRSLPHLAREVRDRIGDLINPKSLAIIAVYRGTGCVGRSRGIGRHWDSCGVHIHNLVPAGTDFVGFRPAPTACVGKMIDGLLRRRPGRDEQYNSGPTRLTADEAERLARAAAARAPFADRLVLRGTWREDDRLFWHFWTATRGSGCGVKIDDATGETLVERFHGR